MKTEYFIDTIRFDDEQSLLHFMRSDTFLVYAVLKTQSLNEPPLDQTEQNALTIIATIDNKREVYLELIQCIWYDVFHQKREYYKWETSYSSPHRSGDNIADPTNEQVEIIKRFQSFVPEFDGIIERIGLNTKMPDDINKEDMPF